MDRRKTMSQEEMFTSKIFLVCTVCELSLNSTVKSYSELSITWSVRAGMQRPHKKKSVYQLQIRPTKATKRIQLLWPRFDTHGEGWKRLGTLICSLMADCLNILHSPGFSGDFFIHYSSS